MARYRATAYIPGLAVEGAEFESDLVPGLAWEPLDKEAKDAVKATEVARAERIEAAKAALAAKRNKAVPAPKVDPKIVELEAELEKAWAEVEALKAAAVKK
jgi:hypothetical protein